MNRAEFSHVAPPLLGNLRLAAAPLGPPGSAVQDAGPPTALIPRSPLFWYAPPWHQIKHLDNLDLAAQLLQLGVTSSALAAQLGPVGAADALEGRRICPYLPDRYDLTLSDLHHAAAIELRLAHRRDAGGRLGVTTDQLHWPEGRTDRPPPGTSLPVSAWPADVVSREALGGKLQQLRYLAPQAVLMVSLPPDDLDREVALACEAGADGVVLRMDEIDSADAQVLGLAVAAMVARTRDLLDRAGGPAFDAPEKGSPPLPSRLLWVVPPQSSTVWLEPADIAKLLALGATGVAIDSWLAAWVEVAAEDLAEPTRRWAEATFGVTVETLPRWQRVPSVTNLLSPYLERLAGCWVATGAASLDRLDASHLVALDPAWAEATGVRPLWKPAP